MNHKSFDVKFLLYNVTFNWQSLESEILCWNYVSTRLKEDFPHEQMLFEVRNCLEKSSLHITNNQLSYFRIHNFIIGLKTLFLKHYYYRPKTVNFITCLKSSKYWANTWRQIETEPEWMWPTWTKIFALWNEL